MKQKTTTNTTGNPEWGNSKNEINTFIRATEKDSIDSRSSGQSR